MAAAARTSSVLAGRAEERAALRALLDAAASGSARTAIVSGEAGIGKTTLVNALAGSYADCLVLSGRCLPLMSVESPFLAIRDVLRNADHDLKPPALDASGDSGSHLVRVDEWVTWLSSRRLVLLIVEDLHWADRGTLDVLTYLMTGPAGRRLAIIATIREQEAGRGHPLGRWLVHVGRLPGVAQIDLRPIDRSATAEQMAAIMGGLPHQSLIDQVFATSRGNPYLTRLLVERLPVGTRRLGDDLPSDLRAALLDAWSDLPDGIPMAAEALAVAAAPMSTADLAVVTEESEEAVLRAVSPAMDVGLLRPAADGAVWFRHPLDAEVIGEQMASRLRLHLHAAVAHHLAGGGIRLLAAPGAIVDHWLEAGDVTLARIAALSAAVGAERSGRWHDVVRILGRVLSMDDIEDRNQDLRLVRRIQTAAANAGLQQRELEAIETLLASSSIQDDPADAADLMIRLTRLRFVTGRGVPSLAAARAALAVADAAPETAGHALAIADLARTELSHEIDAGRDRADRAVAEARAISDDRCLAWALTAKAMASISLADRAAAAAYAAEAAEAALRCRDWMAFTSAAAWDGNACDTVSSRTFVERLCLRREQLLAADAPHVYVAFLAAGEADGLMATGDWHGCQQRLRDVFASDPGPLVDVQARLTAARLATWQGRQAEAEQHLTRVGELVDVDEMFTVLEVPAVRAEVLLSAGDATGAFAAAIAGLHSGRLPPEMGEWLLPLAARALADLVQDARDHNTDQDDRLTDLRELLDTHPHVERQMPSAPVYDEQVEALDALYAAEVARAVNPQRQSERWLVAADQLESAQLPWEAAYAAFRAADALLSQESDRRRGADVLRRGLLLAYPAGRARRDAAAGARTSSAHPARKAIRRAPARRRGCDRPGTRGLVVGRGRTHLRRDRPCAVHQREDGQHPRLPPAGQDRHDEPRRIGRSHRKGGTVR